MKTSRILFLIVLSFSLLTTASAQPIRELLKRPNFRLYGVVFGITVNEQNKITNFRVASVADARTNSKERHAAKVPTEFVAKARKKAEAHHYKPQMKNGKPAEFYIYYFYAPDYPKALISDLYLPQENQP